MLTVGLDCRAPTALTAPAVDKGLLVWWLPQDPFYLDGDVDAVANHDSTALEGNVERHAEVAAGERFRIVRATSDDPV